MNIQLAIEYIPRRMKELGFGSDYYLNFRHFVLQPKEQVSIDAYNQFFILVEEASEVTITSDFGLYDLANPNTNEQRYEHQGTISITNNLPNQTHIKFIQIIPKN